MNYRLSIKLVDTLTTATGTSMREIAAKCTIEDGRIPRTIQTIPYSTTVYLSVPNEGQQPGPRLEAMELVFGEPAPISSLYCLFPVYAQ
jgi:hypothetical protein